MEIVARGESERTKGCHFRLALAVLRPHQPLFRLAMSITKRYFTSLLSMRS